MYVSKALVTVIRPLFIVNSSIIFFSTNESSLPQHSHYISRANIYRTHNRDFKQISKLDQCNLQKHSLQSTDRDILYK